MEVVLPEPALGEVPLREDGPPMEVNLPDPALGEAPHREDVPPMEDMLPPRDADEPEPITDPAWSLNLGKWSKHVSSEIAKQVVTTIMLAPDVEGYTTRGVTVNSVPVGQVAQFITSRHHVPSEADWRRTAVQLREEDQWYWTGPVENWATMPHPNEELTMEGFTIRYMVTIFYDQNREDGAPSYKHKTRLDDARDWEITMGDDGGLRKKDLSGRWRKVDESGTGIRTGSTRPPGIPGDLHEILTKSKKSKASKGGASSSAVPAAPSLKSCMRQKEIKKTPSIMRIAIDIGGVISKQTHGNPTLNVDWHMTRDSEVPRAMLSIRQLVRDFGADNVFIISKAGPIMDKLSLVTGSPTRWSSTKSQDSSLKTFTFVPLDLDQEEKE